MKLSISNIAWDSEFDYDMYRLMNKYQYSGLEVAPTRIFKEQAYNKRVDAEEWRKRLKENHGLAVSSMQSIWYGRQEKLFGTDEERNYLIEYTKKAIDFAVAMRCKNLVFGCPANRSIPDYADPQIAITLFKELGDYAYKKGTVLALEAVPAVYHTNFINNTLEALEFIQKVNSKGFLLNLDVGTIIYNQENLEELVEQVQYINHVHISEPGLKLLERRELHRQLRNLLISRGYSGFVSIEMGKQEDIALLEDTMQYIAGVFKDDL